MRKSKILIVFLVLLMTITKPGLATNIDSLKNLLRNSSGEEKAELLLKLSKASLGTNISIGIDYSIQAIEVALKTADNQLIGKTYHECGKVYNQMAEDQKALESFQKALEYYEKGDFPEESADAMLGMANSQNFLNQYDLSITSSENALKIGNELKNLRILGSGYYNIGNSYYNKNDFKKALEYHLKSLQVREKSGEKNDIAASLNRLGILYYNQAEFIKAVDFYKRVLEIRIEIHDTKGSAIAMLNLGNAYFQMGNYDDAIGNYKQAYDYFRKLDYKNGIASTLNGIAVIYEAWNQYPSALDAYKEMLTIQEELGNDKEIANAYSNIGIAYTSMGTDSLEKLYGRQFKDTILLKGYRPTIQYFDEAIKNNLLALKKRREINDIRGIGTSLVNLGNTYSCIGNLKLAREYFRAWLKIADEIQDDDQQSTIYMSLGQIYYDEGNFEQALEYNNRAYELAKRINKKSYLRMITLNLSKAYAAIGEYKRALAYFMESNDIQGSLMTEESQKLIHEMQVKYETDAKENENRLLLADQKLKVASLKQKNNAIYFFISIIVAFIGFVIMLIRQNSQRKKANEELARKNTLITEQKKEITDSIQYASRIQNAILPPDFYIDTLLPERFIIFRPRDIVSGDYYWITEKNNKIFTMIADCTGHGVPGAFMSMLGIAFLNEIVSKHNEIHAHDILNELRRQVIGSLHQTGREGENQDGMDVALFILDRSNNKLEFAGANNPLLIFRDNKMMEFKSDNMPIGIHKNADKSFTNHEFVVEEGDVIYAFSDGYTDQFGGIKEKKFMLKNFKSLLQEIHNRPMDEQKIYLENTLDQWMGSLNQIDDILVMGVRIV